MLEIRNSPISSIKFHTLDIKRFVGLGSLESLCKSYVKDEEMKKEKKELFLQLNNRFNNGTLLKVDEYSEELKKYAILDVVSLAALTRSFIFCLLSVMKNHKLENELMNCISLPQFAFKYFAKSVKNLKNKPKKFKKLFDKKGEIVVADNKEMYLFKEDEKIMNDKLNTYKLFSRLKTGGRNECSRTSINKKICK